MIGFRIISLSMVYKKYWQVLQSIYQILNNATRKEWLALPAKFTGKQTNA
jgi:hypothetical protein